MAWNMDGVIDTDELNSILSLFPDDKTQADVELAVALDGNVIMGETTGKAGDNVLQLIGYHIKIQVNPNDENRLNLGSLWAIRNVDSASAALTSALKACMGQSKKTLDVELAVYKAGAIGGGGIGPRPYIRLILDGARLILQTFQMNKTSGITTEVLAFTYKALEVQTSPQLSSGLIGPVSSCQLKS